MKTIQGIAIKCTRYRDNDAIISILNNDNLTNIIIRGAYSKNSRYLAFAKTFYKAEFEVYEGKTRYLKLKDAKIIVDYNYWFVTKNKIITFQIIEEFFNKIFNKDQCKIFYMLINLTLNNIMNSNKDEIFLTLLFVYGLKISGYQINICDEKNVLQSYGYSVRDSRFVEELDQYCFPLNKDEINFLIYSFKNKYATVVKNIDFFNINWIKIIRLLAYQFEYYSEDKLISISLI